MAVRAELRESVLFKGLTEEQFKFVTQDLAEKNLEAGAVLFLKGDVAATMFILQQGTLQLIADDAEDKQSVVGTLSPGEPLGEMAIISDVPRSVTARAKEDCNLLVLSRENVAQLTRADPVLWSTLIYNIANILCQRIEEINAKLVAPSQSGPKGQEKKPWMSFLRN